MAERGSYSNQYRFRAALTETDEPLSLEQHAKAARSVRDADADISMTSRQSNVSHNSRSIVRGSKAVKNTTNYSRVNKTLLMECMSEKHIEMASIEKPVNDKHYSTAANLHLPVKDDSEVVSGLRDRCSKLERINSQLADELNTVRQEAAQVRGLYQGKLEEVSNVSYEITTRIEKEQADKNLFIKEINHKNIEINKLRESTSVLRAENETLNLMLKEKENEVEQLEGRLEEVQLQKDRLEKYQLQASSSASILQQIEEKMVEMEGQVKLKDKTIEEMRTKIDLFSDRVQVYENRVAELDQSAVMFSSERSKLQDRLAEAEAQCAEWKQSYLEANRELEHLPEIQIKLKNANTTIQDLQKRIQELLEAQQKLKMQVNSQGLKDRRLSELESSLQSCQRSLRQKQEQLEQILEEFNRVQFQNKNSTTHQETISSLERQLEEKTRELKAFERKYEEKNILWGNLDRELKRLTEENDKFKERTEKWDFISKENKRLTSTLMEKIEYISKLETTLNLHESKIASLTNDLLKQTALADQSNQVVSELNTTLQTLQTKFDMEVTLKLQLEHKCGTLAAEVTSLSKSLTREKEGSRQFTLERDTLRREIEQLEVRLSEEATRAELTRSNYESQMKHERNRQEQIATQMREVRRRCQQLARHEKDLSEAVSTLESDKRTMLNEYSTLRSNYEQAVSKNSALEKWHSGYMHFMSAINRTVGEMEHTSQQLLA